jgi:hypothetical protein
MTDRITVCVGLTGGFAALLALLGGSPSGFPARPLPYYIAKLGSDEASSQLDFIDQFGCAAVPELVGNLRVVPRGHYPPQHQPEEVQRVVYLVAALRYVTGEDFYGTISPPELKAYDGPGRQFLLEDAPPRHAKFFGWWMSRGSLYLAPERTQAQIIAAWRRYARSGACKHSTWRGRTLSNFYLAGDRTTQ